MDNNIKKVLLTAAVAGILGTSLSVGNAMAAPAPDKAGKCWGANDCSGKGDCKTAKNDCAGKNGCGGQEKGWKKMTKAECKKMNKGEKKTKWEPIKG